MWNSCGKLSDSAENAQNVAKLIGHFDPSVIASSNPHPNRDTGWAGSLCAEPEGRNGPHVCAHVLRDRDAQVAGIRFGQLTGIRDRASRIGGVSGGERNERDLRPYPFSIGAQL